MEKQIRELYRRLKPASYNGGWMTDNANWAFLISLGTGPWKYDRRLVVQCNALSWFEKNKYMDLLWARPAGVYPFDWQNNFLSNMIFSLKDRGDTLKSMCHWWSGRPYYKDSILQLFDMCGVKPSGSKVLWMFARDFLGLPAFPIDRHVKRFLKGNNLPIDPWKIVEICKKADVDPGDFNRRIFSASSTNQ